MARATMNKAVLIGRLGKDPEVRYTTKGTPTGLLTVATTQSTKTQDGERREHTDWHRVVVWRRLAEICGQYMKKGSLVLVEGQVKTRSYNDKNGVKRYVTEIVAETVRMLGSNRQKPQAVAQ